MQKLRAQNITNACGIICGLHSREPPVQEVAPDRIIILSFIIIYIGLPPQEALAALPCPDSSTGATIYLYICTLRLHCMVFSFAS